MDGFALPRIRARRRRWKPKPPWWWMTAIMLAFWACAAVLAALGGDWLLSVADILYAQVFFYGLRNPPFYTCPISLWVCWWPPAVALTIAGMATGE